MKEWNSSRKLFPGPTAAAADLPAVPITQTPSWKAAADVTLCPVGGPSVSSALAAVMGIEAGSVEGEYAVVLCGGYDNKTDKIFEYQDIPTCKAVKSLYGGAGACGHGCLGYGD